MPMEVSMVPCYLVKVLVVPEVLGHHCMDTYFLAKSDQDAVKDSLRHAEAVANTYMVKVTQVQVLDCSLGPMVDGVNSGGIDRLLYDSSCLDDSITQERPEFIGREPLVVG
jgi:hypothetical protein